MTWKYPGWYLSWEIDLRSRHLSQMTDSRKPVSMVHVPAQIRTRYLHEIHEVRCSLLCIYSFLFLISLRGVRLSPLATSATIWLIVPAPDDEWWWAWSSQWNVWQGKLNYSEKTCTNTNLSTKNHIWRNLGQNTGSRGGKPATDRLKYSTAQPIFCNLFWRKSLFTFGFREIILL
jgi:hypothetical protein